MSFHLVLNKNGQPQARDLMAAQTTTSTTAPRPMIVPPARATTTTANARPLPTPKPIPQVIQVSQEDGQQRYIGQIASFIADRRYGFIKSAAARQEFGVDTFLSDKEIAGFTNGDVVSFSVRFNSTLKPQAFDLQPGD